MDHNLPTEEQAPTNKSIWHENKGIYLGYKVDPPADEDNPLAGAWRSTGDEHSYRGEGHIMTLGPPGSGKTRGLVIPNLHRLTDWSIVLIDPKGAACAHTAVHRARKEGPKVIGDNIIVIDPFNVMGKNYPRLVEKYPFLKSVGYNPIGALQPDSDDFVDDANRLAQANIKIDAKGESHWSASAQTLMKGLILGSRKNIDLADLALIRDLLGAPAKQLGVACKDFIDRSGKAEPAIAASLNRFVELTNEQAENRELRSIISTAQTQTDWLDSPLIRADLRAPTNQAAKDKQAAIASGVLKRRPMTVYLIIPPKRLVSHGTWLRIMIASILSPLMNSVEDSKVPVMLILDEIAQLGRLEVIQDNIALVREYGVKLWTVWQGLAQAERIYDKGFEDFFATAGVLQSYAVRDQFGREYLSKLSGHKFYEHTNRSDGKSRQLGADLSRSDSTNTSTQRTQGPHFWPRHLGAIQKGQGVLFTERGDMRRAVFPQPEAMQVEAGRPVKGTIAAMMEQARRDIRGE
jgi:type IV secretion system protein VirD4